MCERGIGLQGGGWGVGVAEGVGDAGAGGFGEAFFGGAGGGGGAVEELKLAGEFAAGAADEGMAGEGEAIGPGERLVEGMRGERAGLFAFGVEDSPEFAQRAAALIGLGIRSFTHQDVV